MADEVAASRERPGERRAGERQKRQQINRAQGAPHANRVDEQRRPGDRHHQQDLQPTDGAMRARALRRRELRRAQADRRESETGVRLDDRRGGEQRRERHAEAPYYVYVDNI